jgi:hypothetical protein
MKAPILGLAVATVAFAGSSVYLWSQLNQERARADDLNRRLNERVAELERTRGDLDEHRLDAGPGLFAPGQTPAIPPTATNAGPQSVGETVDSAVALNLQGPRPDRVPGYQKMMRGQIRANNRRMYGDVAEQLGLSKEDAGKLIDLLSEQQLANMTRAQDSTNPAEIRQEWEQFRREQQSQIVDLIGADKAEELRKYQDSMPARGEVEMIARQLEGSDAPLKEDQRKRLVTVLTEERARVPMPEFNGGADQQQYAKAANEWQADYDQRVNAQARGILDSEQYNAYSEYQQWQREMREEFATTRALQMRGNEVRGNVVMYGAPIGVASAAVAVPAPPPEAPKKK